MPHVDIDMLSGHLREAIINDMRMRGMYYLPQYSMRWDFGAEKPKSSEAPKPAATPEKPTAVSIADDIRRLAQSNPKADLSAIPGVVEAEERKRKERIVSDLQSVANLAKRKEVKAKRFVLTCWEHEEAKSYEGIDFAHGRYIAKEDESDEYRVFVVGETSASPTGEWYTLETLKKELDAAKIPHVVSYRD